eukprot:4722756-Lingulodinium_polyedra.AAC.1
MTGAPVWVCLPRDQRCGKAATMERPVCRLLKVLYGHPDAGTFWEKKCDSHSQKVGFEPLGPEWL